MTEGDADSAPLTLADLGPDAQECQGLAYLSLTDAAELTRETVGQTLLRVAAAHPDRPALLWLTESGGRRDELVGSGGESVGRSAGVGSHQPHACTNRRARRKFHGLDRRCALVASGFRPGFHGHGLFFEASLDQRRQMWLACLDVIAALHTLDTAALPLPASLTRYSNGRDAVPGMLDVIERQLQWAAIGPPVLDEALRYLRAKARVLQPISVSTLPPHAHRDVGRGPRRRRSLRSARDLTSPVRLQQGRPDVEELTEFAAARLGQQKRPVEWILVPDFPRTSTGKVRKHLLREGYRDGQYRPLRREPSRSPGEACE